MFVEHFLDWIFILFFLVFFDLILIRTLPVAAQWIWFRHFVCRTILGTITLSRSSTGCTMTWATCWTTNSGSCTSWRTILWARRRTLTRHASARPFGITFSACLASVTMTTTTARWIRCWNDPWRPTSRRPSVFPNGSPEPITTTSSRSSITRKRWETFLITLLPSSGGN